MSTRRFGVLVEWDPEDEVWVTHVPSLGYLSTHGETREEALEQTREAVLGYLEAAGKEGLELPGEDQQPDIVEIEVTAAAMLTRKLGLGHVVTGTTVAGTADGAAPRTRGRDQLRTLLRLARRLAPGRGTTRVRSGAPTSVARS
jgi:predicted RNase H-like HicB family nuclease